MSLVWQCARCGVTDPGTESQREGRQPPATWLPIYRPTGTQAQRQDVICGDCRAAFGEWLEDGAR